MSKFKFRDGLMFMIAIGLGLVVTAARGGNLTPPAGPESAGSAMWTLDDIYNVLSTRTTNVTLRAGGFTEPTAGPTNGTMHTLNEIMTLVTNRSPVQRTGQTTSYTNRDDGALQIGVVWPNPRFTVLGDTNSPVDVLTNCVRDNLTGLIWARNANMFGLVNWATAVTNCNTLNYGGQTDWRLPNLRELFSLIDVRVVAPAVCNTAGTAKWTAGNPFTSISTANEYYWTSTKFTADVGMWCVRINYGILNYKATHALNPVWPVRGGQ